MEQVGRPGGEDAAGDGPDLAQPRGPFGSRGHHAAHGVAVAAEELGGAVQHHGGTVPEGLLEDRAGEGVVDQERDAVRGGGHAGNVDELQARVGRRLQDHQAGVRPERGVDALRGRERDVVAEHAGGQQVVASAVQRPHGDHVLLSGGDDGEQHRAERRHAGGEGDGLRGVFEDGDAFLEPCHGGIPEPLVDGALPLHVRAAGGHVLIGEAAVVHGGKRRRGGKIDRHCVHAQFSEAVPAGVDGQRILRKHVAPYEYSPLNSASIWQ